MAFQKLELFEHIAKALEVEELRFAEFQLARVSFEEAEAISNFYIKQKEDVLNQTVKKAESELTILLKIRSARYNCKVGT